MANSLVYFCLLSALFAAIVANQEGVPALLWTNTEAEFPTPLAGHTTRQNEFKSDYLDHSAAKAGHVLMAFLQDKLSLEDIIDNADVYNEHSTGSKFANLKKLVETYSSVHLPAVFSPGEAIDKLSQTFKGKVHHLKAPYKMDHIVLDSSVPNLVIAHLPHNDGKSFDKIDGIIGSLTDNLKSLKVPFTAVYTGHKPSQTETKAVENSYTGRHLLAVDQDGASYFNNTCLLAYYESMVLDVVIGEKDKMQRFSYDLKNGQFSDSACDNGTSGKLVINFPKQEDLESMSFTMAFQYDKYGYWQSVMEIRYSIINATKKVDLKNTVKMQSDMIYGPKGFSYHCAAPTPIRQIEKGNTTVKNFATLKIKQFQVQFDGISNGKFGRVNDCEAFFSAPVLSGLFAGIILLSILSFGMCMIVNIQTMDRFDDPKGKTITVNTGD